MTSGEAHVGPVARAAALAALGNGPALGLDVSDALRASAETDPDPRVRTAAVAAIVRVGAVELAHAAWTAAAVDPHAGVRRRAAEMGPTLLDRMGDDHPDAVRLGIAHALVAAIDDDDVTVIEAAAWALGERGALAVEAGAVAALAVVTTTHVDAIAREAAVAALGAIGEPSGLAAILHATADKPTVRRRAVLALAPFDGDEVDAALARALDDRDWQVRQAAEDLSAPHADGDRQRSP